MIVTKIFLSKMSWNIPFREASQFFPFGQRSNLFITFFGLFSYGRPYGPGDFCSLSKRVLLHFIYPWTTTTTGVKSLNLIGGIAGVTQGFDFEIFPGNHLRTRFQLILPVDSQNVTKKIGRVTENAKLTAGTSPSIRVHVLFISKRSDKKYKRISFSLHRICNATNSKWGSTSAARNSALKTPYPPLPYIFWTVWTWGFTRYHLKYTIPIQ